MFRNYKRKKTNTVHEGTCPACGEKSRGHVEDCGFAYEYGSERGSTHDYRIFSNCCNEEMTDVESFDDVDIDPEPDHYLGGRR